FHESHGSGGHDPGHDEDGHDGDHDPGHDAGHDPGHDGGAGAPPPSRGLPDFQVDASATQRSVRIAEEELDSRSCAVAENCVTGTGRRKLLKFDAIILNTGTADFVLGDPSSNDDFEHSA